MLGCSWPGSEREQEGETTDDHHQRLRHGKGVWHSEGSGRDQREKEGHSIEMERDLYNYSMDTIINDEACQPVLLSFIVLVM